MAVAPKWAQDLLINALLHLESEGHKINVPTLNWRRGTHYRSSGNANQDKITITAGTNRLDQKLVLLHEIVHTVAKPQGQYIKIDPHTRVRHLSRRTWHTAEFWDIAWSLYRWAKLPIRYCQKREYSYKVGARVAYRRNRNKARGNKESDKHET